MGEMITRDAQEGQAVAAPLWLALYVRREGQGAPQRCDDLAALGQALEQGAEAGLVLYEEPARALARALMAGQAQPEALADWRAAISDCLAVQRRHRRRLVMLSAPVAEGAEAPVALAPGMTLPETGPLPEAPPETACALAALALSLDAEAVALMDALQAATAGPFPDLPAPATLLATVAGDWRAKLEDAGKAKGLAAEGTLLTGQIAALEAALRQTDTARRETVDTLAAERVAHQVRIDELMAARAELERQHKNQRDGFTRGAQVLSDQVTALEAHLKQAQDQLANAKATHERDRAALEKQLADARATHDRDRAALEKQATEAKAAHDRDRKALETQVSEARGALETLRGEADRLNRDLEAAQAELAAREKGAALLTRQVADLGSALREAETAHKRDRATLVEQMEEAAARAGTERAALAEAMQQAEDAARATAARQRSEHEAALARIRGEAETLHRDLETARGELRIREKGATILTQQVAALGSMLREAEALRRDVTRERQMIDRNYRTRVAQLGGMLDAVYKSTSWRMTGPMRSVVRRIRR